MESKYFKIEELVPPRLNNILHKEALWNLIDNDLIESIDYIKEKFSKGSIIINSYLWHGDRVDSGIRTRLGRYYSETSQHSLGKAVDMVFTKYTIDEVRDYILANQDEFPLIGGIELGTSWLHLDTRARREGKIITFSK